VLAADDDLAVEDSVVARESRGQLGELRELGRCLRARTAPESDPPVRDRGDDAEPVPLHLGRPPLAGGSPPGGWHGAEAGRDHGVTPGSRPGRTSSSRSLRGSVTGASPQPRLRPELTGALSSWVLI
jgi:hypothetical protein